jgi:hypothetical protein
MGGAEPLLGALGGLSAFIALLIAGFRLIFGQIKAIRDNTDSTRELTKEVQKLTGMYNGHETRISRLEGSTHYRPPP